MDELIKLIFRKTRGIDEDCDNDFNCSDCYCSSKMLASFIYEAGYRKIPDGAVILSPEERDEEMKAYNEERKERENELLTIQMACFSAQVENEGLKAENKRLSGKLGQILLSIDTVKEMNAMCNIDKQRKQAVKEFARKVKNCSYCDNDFMDGKWHRYVFVDDIDGLLKEYENEDRR